MLSFFKNLFGKPKKCPGNKTLLELSDADVNAVLGLDEKVVVGKVSSVDAHPNPKMTKVRVAQVVVDTNGNEETICCGGTNLEAGQIVTVAKVGTVLPGDFEIGVRDLRGVESRGMICARKELGINADKEGEKEIWAMDPTCESFIGISLKELV